MTVTRSKTKNVPINLPSRTAISSFLNEWDEPNTTAPSNETFYFSDLYLKLSQMMSICCLLPCLPFIYLYLRSIHSTNAHEQIPNSESATNSSTDESGSDSSNLSSNDSNQSTHSIIHPPLQPPTLDNTTNEGDLPRLNTNLDHYDKNNHEAIEISNQPEIQRLKLPDELNLKFSESNTSEETQSSIDLLFKCLKTNPKFILTKPQYQGILDTFDLIQQHETFNVIKKNLFSCLEFNLIRFISHGIPTDKLQQFYESLVNCYSQHPWDYFKTIHTSILSTKERSQSDSFRDSIEVFNILSSTDFLNANRNEQIFFNMR